MRFEIDTTINLLFYINEWQANDIAVVTLDSPVVGITPVQLPRIGSTLRWLPLYILYYIKLKKCFSITIRELRLALDRCTYYPPWLAPISGVFSLLLLKKKQTFQYNIVLFTPVLFSYAGSWATIIGFGRTQKTLAEEESSGQGSNYLLESSVQIISNTNCSAMYVDTKIPGSMMCAYAVGTDTCQVGNYSTEKR